MIKTVWLTLNRKCNLQCQWCYSKYSNKNENMNFEEVKKQIIRLERQGIKKIILIGGEPLLYKNIIELVAFINGLGINQSVTTNGILLKDYDFCKKLVSSGIKNFNMSLKGNNEDQYTKYTNRKNGLSEFLRGYNNLKNLGIKPVVSYVIVDDNKENFDNLIDMLIENNIYDVCFQFVKPALTLEEKQDKQELDRMGMFCEYIFTKLRKTAIDFSFEISFPLCLIKKEVLEQMMKEKCISTCCHIQKGTGLIFDTNFNILPCNHFANYPFSIEKNEILQSNIADIFSNNKEIIEFRKKVSCYPSLKCKSCSLWDYCGGGCFTRWLYDDPDDYIK